MDVRLTDEQELLAETARKLAERIRPATPRDLDERDRSGDWSAIADVGLTAMAFPPELGGAGASVTDVALVLEALGRGPCALPFLGSAVLATRLAAAGGASRDFLAALGEGSLRLAVGLDASLKRFATTADGEVVAFDAEGADAVLVLDSERRPVALSTEKARRLEQVDLTRTMLELPATARRVGTPGDTVPVVADDWTRFESLALVALAADLVGVMDGGLDLAVSYAGNRRQFDAPIGSFQAVQHLLADQKVTVEAARSIVWYASWAADHAGAAAALHAARSAKAYCSEAALRVTEAVIQVHGGIGITWECSAHLFLKRALVGRAALGDEADQLRSLAEAARSARG